MKNRHILQDAEPHYGASKMRPNYVTSIANNTVLKVKETQEQRILALESRVQELERTLRDVITILAGKY